MFARSSRRALFALCAASLLAARPSAAGAEPPPAAALAARVDMLMAPLAGKKLPGAAVVVLRDGEVVFSKAYGLASVEQGISNTTQTRFRLASVSKSFTALAVLQLVEQGKLRLEDPLAKYVPGVVGGDRITIRHLLTHTAGMPDFVGFDEAAKMPRDAAPGERLNYSNVGYVGLGRVIEKVTGMRYEEHLRRAIFEPIGMRSTGVGRPGDTGKELAAGYVFGPAGELQPAEFSDTSAEPAAGGLSSTAEDMTLWVKALLAGRIVSPATLERAWTPVALPGGRKGAYGYGFMALPYRGIEERGHGGDISGFNSYVAFYPSERLAVVVLANVGMRPPGPVPQAGDIAHAVVDVLAADHLGAQWPAAVALAPGLLDRYVGRYRLDAAAPVIAVMGDAIEISREGARLFAAGKQGRAEIFAESETVFFSKDGPIRISFERGEKGETPGAVLTLMGLREFALRRVP
jgi:D-alanyl-D-alanine carboxypeptidase